MRDKSHMEQVIRWANYIKDAPREEWKKKMNAIIDAQILTARRFYKNLERTEEGKKILERLRAEKREIKKMILTS